MKLTLVAALLFCRCREITDTLVELLCSTVHRINARAEVRVTNELIREFKRVTGKENLLFRMAEATVDAGDKLVRDTVYPVAPRAVLRDLVAELKSSGPTYQRTVKATLRSSYTNHYRAGLIKLLSVLEFCSNNTTHRPVLDALELIGTYAGGNLRYYPLDEPVPVHRGVSGDWAELVYQTDKRGHRRVVRMVYEICTFQALRDQLRCKEIWVTGAEKWRNPAQDLPIDFEERRIEHYGALRKPLDPSEFVDELREQMRTELDALHAALSGCGWLEIAERSRGAIKLTPLPPVTEPRNLRRLKNEIQTRWGVVPLIDILKETVLRTGCLRAVTSVADRGTLPESVLAERLLLAIYASGTNIGIRAVAVGAHGHGEDEIRYTRRRYLNAEAARRIAIEIANATFAARRTTIWGESSTAIASDSTHFGAFDQNIFTEYHSRYGRGVLIYWSVEKGSPPQLSWWHRLFRRGAMSGPPRIGLAISGGGFRATAFGLGCLRALHDRNLLPFVRVVSGISGGSLLAAMWAYGPRDFTAFDASVTSILGTNLQLELASRTLTPVAITRNLSSLAVSASTGRPRRYNRTDSLVAALSAREFGQRTMSEVTHPGLASVISATDMASGNAVRFGSAANSCSAYGEITSPVTVAEAVAASAAFPVLLPALCRDFQFRDSSGSLTTRTVTMTDGGVYDNLGLSPLLPGRLTEYARHVYDLDYLIAADAGQGRSVGKAPRFWVGRLKRAFEITHTKSQDGSRSRVHLAGESRQVKGFVHAYLGMEDENLPVPVEDLVAREDVEGYRTDFAAMPAASLNAISVRADQLTRVLLAHYCPDLVRTDEH